MAGTMSKADLVADLKASLQSAADVFVAENDADFNRHIDAAAMDMGRFRRRTLLGEITVIADQTSYAAPNDLIAFKSALWGNERITKPWESNWPGRLPDVSLAESLGNVANDYDLLLIPAPTAHQISVLGSSFKFYYYAGHAVGANAADTTIKLIDRGLLLLRAQAEAMKEMAMRNLGKPVQMRDGISNGPRNGTPAALYGQLMESFERLAA